MQTDPYLRSAYYAAFLIHRRAGERDRAKELRGIYERLATNPRAQLAEYKYTRMGRKAEVLVVDNGAPEPQQPGDELFAEPRAIAVGLSGDNASITVADINGDGSLDVLTTTVESGTTSSTSVETR